MPDLNPYLTDVGTLVNAAEARIDLDKLIEYSLNPDHRVGGHKALVFERVLGYNRTNAGELRSRILDRLKTTPARPGPATEHGVQFRVDLVISGPTGREAVVRTGWIFRPGDAIPTLTTAFIRRRGRDAQATAP